MTEMMNAALINNRYRILETLGRGGFGETYLVEDMHLPSGRKCVLKQLKPIVQQSSIPLWMKERFQREAAILEELGAASKQIPELYAYFSENEQFYLVQEWIEGETLAQKQQRQGNLNEVEIGKILKQILPVLDFVHSRKIVHRDIKPDNIVLRSDNHLPVLIDFGAVKEAVATTVEHNSSAFSAAIGTPGYMPSEQAAGRPLYSSDLYSLGLTAIFLLTGKTPQELEIDSQTGEFVWQQYATGVDLQLKTILDRAIRFHPRDRFSQAKEMLEALQSRRNLSRATTSGADEVTGTTVKVSPAMASSGKSGWQFAGTVAYPESRSDKKKKGNWLNKLFFFFLVTGGLTVGTFTVGFYALSNVWRSLTRPDPQVKVEPTIPEPVRTPPERTKPPKEKTEPLIKIGDLIKKKKERQTAEKETPDSEEKSEETATEKSDLPEVVIQPEPKPQPKPKPKPQKIILSTGTSESQLVSTLGQPTSQRNQPQKNSKILMYRDATDDNLNLTYHSDSNGRIKQAEATLNSDSSLGAMQDTLTKLLGNNNSADAKNKLRNVYNRQASLQSFRIGDLQGRIQRDSKDRVNISVWESGY